MPQTDGRTQQATTSGSPGELTKNGYPYPCEYQPDPNLVQL